MANHRRTLIAFGIGALLAAAICVWQGMTGGDISLPTRRVGPATPVSWAQHPVSFVFSALLGSLASGVAVLMLDMFFGIVAALGRMAWDRARR